VSHISNSGIVCEILKPEKKGDVRRERERKNQKSGVGRRPKPTPGSQRERVFPEHDQENVSGWRNPQISDAEKASKSGVGALQSDLGRMGGGR
jgi:hypothetical protein